MSEISVQAPNSLLLIGDPSGAVPESMNGLVSSTSSCVAVGTLLEQDGPTQIRLLSNSRQGTSLPPTLAWEGFLETPNGKIAVQSILGQTYIEEKTKASSVFVRVYVNHVTEPDQITILFSSDASYSDCRDSYQFSPES